MAARPCTDESDAGDALVVLCLDLLDELAHSQVPNLNPIE